MKNLEDVLASRGHRLPSKYNTSLPSSYRPEIDTSSELKVDVVTECQELVGVLKWAIELTRVNINLEVSVM